MKTVPNFSRYQADIKGNLYSTNYKNSGKTKILKPAISKDGYPHTMLQRDDGKYCTMKVHKIIALTYFGPKVGENEINHKNGIKTDNSVSNLEYCSRSENVKHAYRTGLNPPKRGELNGKSKLTEKDVIEIRTHAKNFIGRYYGRKALAEKYGVSEAHIKDIVTKRRDVWPSVSI